MNLTYKEPNYLTTKQFADLAGTTVSNICYWDRVGKLYPIERTPGGWRYYTMEQLDDAKKLVQKNKERKERNIMKQNGWI